jgi:hypothetical protein
MAAPIGNNFAEGNDGGRPPIHTDPKQVVSLIEDYYEWIEGEWHEDEITVNTEDGEKKQKVKVWDRRPEPPTVTGLALHLGFADKSSLYDYKKKDEFSHPIKRAISRIEKYHEIAIAHGDKCTGNIFALKNFGWKDKSEVDHNIKSEQPLFPD